MLHRASVNALVAHERGDFAAYVYDKGHPGECYWMLFDSSEDGLWSHIERQTREEVWQQIDKEAAAAPYASDLNLALKLLLPELSISSQAAICDSMTELASSHSDEVALQIALAWLRDVYGHRVSRHQVMDDLRDSNEHEEH